MPEIKNTKSIDGFRISTKPVKKRPALTNINQCSKGVQCNTGSDSDVDLLNNENIGLQYLDIKEDNLGDDRMSSEKGRKSYLRIIRIVVFVIFSLCLISFSVAITITGIFPMKILVGIWAVISLIVAVLGFFSLHKKHKKIIDIISFSFEAVVIALLCVATYYFNITTGFLNKINSLNYQIEEYYVIVKSDSDIYQLEDLNEKTLGIYNDVSDNYNAALNEVVSLVNVEKITHDDFTDAAIAMLDGADHALLLKGAMQEVVSEIVPDFTNKNIRIIYTAQVKTPLAEDTEGQSIDISTEPFNIFISGIDTYGEISKVARSDVNMIVSINPKTNRILLTSIPRDYYVQLHGTTGTKDKLTHAGIYGVDMSRQTLEDLFNITIPYYVRVNFSTLVQVIDSIDGIDITPDTTFVAKSDKSCYFTSGQTQHVYGKCALAYSRERYAYASGDRHRVQNQQDVLAAVINKVTSSKVLVSKYSDLLSSLSGGIQTNIPRSQIYKLVNTQLDKMPSWGIEKISVDGSGSMNVTYSTGSQILYVMIPNEDTLSTAKTKIQDIFMPE